MFKFTKTVNQQRANGCKRVKREAGTAIFGCLDKDLATPEARFEKFGELIGWALDRKGNGYYEPLAPILYSDTPGERKDRIFRNKLLLNVRSIAVVLN
jgi:hypothetical protein